MLFVFSFLAAITQAQVLNSKIYVNRVEQGSFVAGSPTRLQFDFKDATTGQSPHHFHEMHEKPMHLIVVSEDLQTFAHLHPSFKTLSSRPFEITINQPHADPDNFQAEAAAHFSGRYFLFGEVMPMDYGMLTFPYEISASGPARSLAVLSEDPKDANGFYWKQMGNLLLRLQVEPVEHCGQWLPKLNIKIFKVLPDSSTSEVDDLDLWLGSFGHALIVSDAGKTALEKNVMHLHAVWPLPDDSGAPIQRGPNLELFGHSHQGLGPSLGLLKTWIQFKYQNQVHTFDFVFNWDFVPPVENSFLGILNTFCLAGRFK